MIFIHKICIALSGLGRPITVETAMSERAAILLHKKLSMAKVFRGEKERLTC